jgi:hypothetical protein
LKAYQSLTKDDILSICEQDEAQLKLSDRLKLFGTATFFEKLNFPGLRYNWWTSIAT